MPPIVFSAAALGNVYRVIPDQTKLAICGEWFRQVEPPVIVSAAYKHGDGRALEVLGRMLRRLDVAGDEVVIHLTIEGQSSYDLVLECWEKSCRLLGHEYRPKLVSIGDADDGAWRAVGELKIAGLVRGTGIATRDFRSAMQLVPPADWVTLAGGFTLMRHSREVSALMADLADRQIPLIMASVFDGGFLVGCNRLDGRVLNADDPANRSVFAWRKVFVSLCEGHGITPAHACIQFALSAPGVAAVVLNTSYVDRVTENVRSVCHKVPDNFWASMKEEGLLAADYPYLGG